MIITVTVITALSSSSSSIITFIQGIYKYIPETDCFWEYNDAAILLQFMAHIMFVISP